MENNTPKTSEILSLLKDKYKQMDNLMTFTKEMEKAAGINDLEALRTVLAMRQEAMDKIDSISKDVGKILGEMDPPDRDRMKQILNQTGEPMKFNDQLENNISDTNRLTYQLLQKIIDLDKTINQRIQKGV